MYLDEELSPAAADVVTAPEKTPLPTGRTKLPRKETVTAATQAPAPQAAAEEKVEFPPAESLAEGEIPNDDDQALPPDELAEAFKERSKEARKTADLDAIRGELFKAQAYLGDALYREVLTVWTEHYKACKAK
jgi:hypothetical protein